MLVRWSDAAVPVSIVVGALAVVVALVAWRADNQMPDTTTFPAYLGGMRTIESQKSSTERTIVMNSSRPTGLTM